MGFQVLSDTVANDSDKSITVGTGISYKLISGSVQFTSTATAGNRQLELRVKDELGNVVFKVAAPSVQAASLTYNYSFGSGIPASTVVALTVMMPIPEDMILLSGWSIQIIDSAAIAAAADDMNMFFLVERIHG